MDPAERRRLALEALGVPTSGVRPRRRRRRKSLPMKPSKEGKFGKKMFRGCITKTRYRSESEARRVANIATSRRGTRLRVYMCPYCGGFHLTKQV